MTEKRLTIAMVVTTILTIIGTIVMWDTEVFYTTNGLTDVDYLWFAWVIIIFILVATNEKIKAKNERKQPSRNNLKL